LRLALFWVLGSVVVPAAAPLTDYQQRVAQAAQLALETASQASLTDAPINQLQTLKQLLPAQEEIETTTPGHLIHVDNRWLHAQLDALSSAPAQRKQQLDELAERLSALQQRLTPAETGATGETQLAAEAARARLERILTQPEYQRDQAQESAIKQWFDKVMEGLRNFMRWLFSATPATPAQPSRYTLNFTRTLIIIVLCLGLLFALYKLFQWFRARRQQSPAKKLTREILGEQINEHTTTADLLAAARALAKQGDYRSAIRRAYIALLYELEQQGKLRLHQAKTNRDYQEALRHEQAVYLPFLAVTRIFERSWYGHVNATEFDFEGFLTGYHETLKQDSAPGS
jgi:hypothetical protein